MQGKLAFDQATLADTARQFNRYRGKQLVIEDEAAARIGIGGVFDATNVEAFARLLHVGFGLLEGVAADILGHEKPTMTYGLYSGGTSLKQKRDAIHKLKYPMS